jgi:hypothetical protein
MNKSKYLRSLLRRPQIDIPRIEYPRRSAIELRDELRERLERLPKTNIGGKDEVAFLSDLTKLLLMDNTLYNELFSEYTNKMEIPYLDYEFLDPNLRNR